MANQEVSEIITRLTVAKTVDAGRAVGDPHILPPTLRTDVDGDLAILLARETDTAPAEGVRAGASGARRVALDELERQHRGGYRVIKGIDEDEWCLKATAGPAGRSAFSPTPGSWKWRGWRRR